MEQKDNRKILGAAVVLVVLLAAAAILYFVFRPKAAEGSKEITVTVVDDTEARIKYETKTDAEFLRGALEEIEDLKLEGGEGDYGFYVTAINGVTADDGDGAYWAFYVNGEYCNFGIEEQPVYDGDNFEIKYEIWSE